MGKITRRSSAVLATAVAATLAVAPSALADIDDPDPDNLGITGESSSTRLAGADRIATSIAASRAMDQAAIGDTVILAYWMDFPDALTAGPLADRLDAPVLLTKGDQLDARTGAELVRLFNEAGVENVIVVGGADVVSNNVAEQVGSLGRNVAGVFTPYFADGVDRIAGIDRYETATLVAERLLEEYDESGELAQLRLDLAAAIEARADLDEALAAYDEASAEFAAASAAVTAAEAAVDAAADAVLEALAGLPVDGVEAPDGIPGNAEPTWEEYVQYYEDELADASRDANYQESVAARDYLRALPAQVGADGVQLPLNQYTDAEGNLLYVTPTLPDGEGSELYEALDVLSIPEATPLLDSALNANDGARSLAATAVENIEAGLAPEIGAYQAAVAAALEAAEAATAEGPAREALRVAQAALTEAQAALEAAEEAEDEAEAAEAEAEGDLRDAADAVLGGPAPAVIEAQIAAARAALIAESDAAVFLTTGYNPAAPEFSFADALAAGPVASAEDGVILLTRDNGFDSRGFTQGFLEASEVADIVAIGGPARAAAGDDADQAYAGSDRYETATLVADAFFDGPDYVAVANGLRYADAVVGSGFIANVDGPLVLTREDSLPRVTSNYLQFNAGDIEQVFIFGGTDVITTQVGNAINDALNR